MKEKTVYVRMTDSEYREIKIKAKKLGLAVGTYIRMVALKEV
jgi:predicted DNA binding CopG/RHH family protein